jgi:hypothetical protein
MKRGDRARSKIPQAQQRGIRSLANFADGFPSHGCYRVPDPRKKSDAFDGRVVGKALAQDRASAPLPPPVTSELLSLSGRQAEISAFLVVAHFWPLARGRALPATTSRLGLIFRVHGDRPRELPARWRTIPWKTE